MVLNDDELREKLAHDAYPRSNGYDPRWVIDNQMGPNALWLMEALTQAMPIERDMKVLDLGCGRAITSIFLAREPLFWLVPDAGPTGIDHLHPATGQISGWHCQVLRFAQQS